MSDLPLPVKIDSKRQWRTLAKKNNVEGVNIYNLEDYDSGSKINDPQYLSLRALWKFRPINEFKPCEWGILGVEEARASLMKLEHWADFLQAIPLEVSVEEILPIKHSLGKFELIWYYGQLICCAPSAPDTEENLDFTPLSKRLRERKLKSHGRETSEQTPTHRVRQEQGDKLREQKPTDQSCIDAPLSKLSPEGQGSQFPGTPSTDLDPDTPADDQKGDPSYKEQRRFPRVSDEDLVNLYLLALASVVTLSVEGVNAHWSPERKGFKVCDENGEKLYEARIDGHLFLSNSRETKVIVEVKPVMRDESPRVMMQETAQMAAWIHADRDVIQEDTRVEQRHEIYLIVAEYTADCVDYLTNPGRESACKSFLTMNQFGPWEIGYTTLLDLLRFSDIDRHRYFSQNEPQQLSFRSHER
ncbi:uncharacterized protein BO96DRAFT_486307 [Aspergillus niger CBS 101883]|uniref:uncharacterized protein n=1 Tax=Aspergillus lacticoffeatus (strain CBS 101883) TaxID=1450533 RepID=UPI000D7EC0F0|nr:uncharacterized protein BO96DRAFT_486307 [Aspergillus niger CBS 101883]PYH59762.1 hypothetical protein BO96DRAFT_486307 [Aspergillus niger CBS 101883]